MPTHQPVVTLHEYTNPAGLTTYYADYPLGASRPYATESERWEKVSAYASASGSRVIDYGSGLR